MARKKVGRPSKPGPMVVGDRFRVILPEAVREALGLRVGDSVEFEVRGAAVNLYKVEMRRSQRATEP